MTHGYATRIANKMSEEFLEPALIVNVHGIEDRDRFGGVIDADSPYDVCLDSEFMQAFYDMSPGQMQTRIKSLIG